MITIKHQFLAFLVRWALNTVGIWVSVRLLGSGYETAEPVASIGVFILAGLVFSLINVVLKPIIIILSLPAILLTLGLFTIVVNGFMVYISLALIPGLSMSFGNSIVAGLILSLVNYIVGSIFVQNIHKGEKTCR